MADTIKCPHCAANLKFAAGAQKLQCPFCGGTFALDEVESKAVDEMMAGKTTHAEARSSRILPRQLRSARSADLLR